MTGSLSRGISKQVHADIPQNGVHPRVRKENADEKTNVFLRTLAIPCRL